ncbi:MAG TPA: hypothetical protein VH207_00545 [Chthoniobacterales bacterium]|jgi:hypothetical protein|nr:hypothetical protein [Chthoniobacterales bacterium]
MTSTFPHSILPQAPEPAAFALLHSIFVEPVLLVATCLFWIIVLPISGLFCLGVAFFDRVTAFRGSKVQLLGLRPPTHPLVLRRTASSGEKISTTQRRPGTQTAARA